MAKRFWSIYVYIHGYGLWFMVIFMVVVLVVILMYGLCFKIIKIIVDNFICLIVLCIKSVYVYIRGYGLWFWLWF